jgi:hypothetical protein
MSFSAWRLNKKEVPTTYRGFVVSNCGPLVFNAGGSQLAPYKRHQSGPHHAGDQNGERDVIEGVRENVHDGRPITRR